jgi:hypothetical protein
MQSTALVRASVWGVLLDGISRVVADEVGVGRSLQDERHTKADEQCANSYAL